MIVIIGAGISGLTCAKYLKDSGVNFVVLEVAEQVGGRVRTDLVEGFRLDRGFQVFLTEYPEAKPLLDYDRLKFCKLPSGARVRINDRFAVMPNPLKNFLRAPQALFSPVGSLADKLKILQLVFDTRNAPDPCDATANVEQKPQSTKDFLKSYGFSDRIINRFFVPFFRGVFLEDKLETNASFFKFLYDQFAAGDVVLPANGIQAIPEQLAAHLSPDQLRLGAPVEKIGGNNVYLKNGEVIAADKIVLATDAETAARLLGRKSDTRFNETVCLYFVVDQPLKLEGEPYLIINSNSGELIDHVLIVSEVAPSYAPPGKTLLSVNLVGAQDCADDELTEKVRTELVKWFGENYVWRHLKTYRIERALPQFVRNSLTQENLKADENIFSCGDYTAYPSLNAAMRTGRQVAEALRS